MAESNNTTSGGIGAGFVLFIVFLVLKLCNVIDWSWWWVTCPLWGGVAAVLLVFAAIVLGAIVVATLSKVLSFLMS